MLYINNVWNERKVGIFTFYRIVYNICSNLLIDWPIWFRYCLAKYILKTISTAFTVHLLLYWFTDIQEEKGINNYNEYSMSYFVKRNFLCIGIFRLTTLHNGSDKQKAFLRGNVNNADMRNVMSMKNYISLIWIRNENWSTR